MKLTAEEQEQLHELMEMDYWPVIIKAIAIIVEDQRQRITSVAVDKEADLFTLGMERKKYEGAHSVQFQMESLKRKKEKKNGK
jgi:hypothetical protein